MESLLAEQIDAAKKINALAARHLKTLTEENGEFSVDDSAEMAALTTKLEVYEAEKTSLLAKMGVSMSGLVDISPSLGPLLRQLKDEVVLMREAVSRNAKLLDIQMQKTKGVIDAVRYAVGMEDRMVEYGPKGKKSKGSGSSGGLLGAG